MAEDDRCAAAQEIAIGPVGLGCLKRMKRLKNLCVTDGLLSEADESLLVQALPGLKVHRGWLMASVAPCRRR